MRSPWSRTLYRVDLNATLSAVWADDWGCIREAWSEDGDTRWLRKMRTVPALKSEVERHGGELLEMGRRVIVGTNKE